MKRVVTATLFALAASSASAYYPEWVRSSIATMSAYKIVTADFNGDGRPDVVTRTNAHTVVLSLIQSNGALGSPTVIYQGSYLSDIAVTDFNNDGKIDVIAADIATDTLVALAGNGDGTFAAPVITQLPLAPTEIIAGNFAGDGKAAVVLRSYSAQALALYKGNNAGGFADAWRMDETSAPVRLAGGDLDNDGNLDLVLANSNPVGYEVRFGIGDGTYTAPVTIAGPAVTPQRVVLADLDGDGDREIISCEFDANSVTVVMNGNGRSFAAPVKYTAIDPSLNPYGNPVDLVVADVTGDGNRDVVVSLVNARLIGTLPGSATGILGSPEYASTSGTTYGNPSIYPYYLALGDFDGDTRPDIVIAGDSSRVAIYRNAAGESNVTVRSNYPTISAGQSVTFSVDVYPASGFIYPYSYYAPSYEPPFPTGSVTLKAGTTVIGSAPLQNRTAAITVSSLPAGANSITATFDGDTSYRPSVSAAYTQNVVNETTTATLTRTPQRDIEYGESLQLTATVTSPIAGSTYGSYWLFTDAVRSTYTNSGTTVYWYEYPDVGTHTFYAAYEGNATQPPTTSNSVTQVVTKAKSGTVLYTYTPAVRYGTTATVRAEVNAHYSGSPGGTLRLYEGSTVLTSVTYTSYSMDITLPQLPVGVHYLVARYEGDQHFEPSQSSALKLTIVPATGFVLDVTTSANQISANGFITGSNLHFDIYRKIGSAAWVKVFSNWPYPSVTDYSVPANTPYLYKMLAYDATNNLVATSNIDMAMIVSFTDDPLLAGTTVKAQHVKELADAINAIRSSGGLQPMTLANAAAGDIIRASHVLALRTALNEGRVALGADPVTFSSDVSAGSMMKAQHLQDLREAIR